MSILALGLAPVVFALGVWQLSRAEEKRVLIEDRYARMGALPVSESELDAAPPFTRVRLEGGFDPDRIFFLDNQIIDGETGYAVLHVYESRHGARYLVNRGWVAAPGNRDELPDVGVPVAPVITALVWPFTGLQPIFEADPWGEGWPKRVQRLELDRMAGVAAVAVAAELRLEAGQPGALTPLPDATTLNPGKNTGYAAQWFGIGTVLLAGWVVFGISQGRRDDN